MRFFRLVIGMLLLPVILMTSCTEEENRDPAKANLTFSFALTENKEGRTADGQLSPGASVLLSIESSNGALVLDQHKVLIQKDANGYITRPVHLPLGSYDLVEFIVVDGSEEVLYATPREGSVLSKVISQPLPFKFSIESDDVIDKRVAVLHTGTKTAKSFGYESFRRQPHSLKVQVHIRNDKKLLPASAEALIMKGLDTLMMYQLSEKMNTLAFDGDPGETYTLVVVKDSYARFSQNFAVNDVKGKPLKIVMDPALTVVGIPRADQNYFGMQLDPAWGIFDFMVDWGDGTNEIWTSGNDTALGHFYQQPGHYFISITGNGLDSVVLVGNLVEQGRIQRLGMEHLVNLRDFRIEYGQGPKVIDLSHSPFLSEVRIYPREGEASPLEDLIIPDNAAIYLLEIGGNLNLKAESLNELINDLHHQVANAPRSGDFWYGRWEDPNVPVVTPSPEALAKLRDLKNTYGWVVNPDPRPGH